MAGEAYWILSGSDKVKDIAPFNKHISQFSDDGSAFAGAYGPMVVKQLDYVVDRLTMDDATRQAVLTIWKPNPPKSKDIPCTVAMNFQLRDGVLHNHVFMRSSDVWLGLPYDIFNFSTIAYKVAARLNELMVPNLRCRPGTLFLTLCSSHMYLDNKGLATNLVSRIGADPLRDCDRRTQPDSLLWENPLFLMSYLGMLRHSKRGDAARWWEQ
jgi:thymidylate synthase